MRHAPVVCLIFCASIPVVSQTIRVTVDLVQVDAVVTGPDGRHVPGLKAEDFQILEDGKPQAITHFEYVHSDPLPQSAAAPTTASPKTAIGVTLPPTLSSPSQPLRPEQIHRTIVLLVDDFGLSAGEIPRVRTMLANFIDRQMQPGDLVSIMTSSGSSGSLDQFTTDKRLLHAAADRIRLHQGRNGLTWYEPVHQLQPGGAGLADAATAQRVSAMTHVNFALGSAIAIRYAIEGLRDLPGRKALALFSDGGVGSSPNVVEAANRASVVLYTFDARGLESFNLSAVDSIYANGSAQNIVGAETARQREFAGAQESLAFLARGTGGVFFHDNNGLAQGLEAALNDMSSYYLIGYQPHREDFERTKEGSAHYHRIQVKVLRAGLNVRSRQGFLGVPDPPASTLPLNSAALDSAAQLRHALSSPFAATGVPVQLSAFFSAGDGAGDSKAQPGHLPLRLRAMMVIDARALKFEDTPDGKKKIHLDALAAAFGADNKPVGLNDETFLADLSPEEADRIATSGLIYSLNIPVTRPGPWQLRVAITDRNSGLIGSASSFIDVPDVNGKRVALTSIVLHDADTARDEALAKAGFPGAGGAVTRVFAPGTVLTWESNVTGSVPLRPPAKPQIEMRVQLYRGAERIFSGQPIPLAIQGFARASIYATGTVKLPATLPPGAYSMELIAVDRKQPPKLQQAVQWTDFTLVAVQPTQ